jgi:hypothetical protein
VELLIATLLAATVGLVALQTTRQILQMTTSLSRRTLAWERGQTALSILEPRIIHAGLGVTYSRANTEFSRSFGGSAPNFPLLGQWTDRGPLQVWQGYPSLTSLSPETNGVCRGRGLVVLYAVPSGHVAKTLGNAVLPMSAGVDVKINLTPSEQLSIVADRLSTTARKDLRAWVAFPLMGYPVYASLFSHGELTIRLADGSNLSAELSPLDEMHYLRVTRFQATKNVLQSEELYSTWTAPEARADGVLEMWFEWTPSKKLLDAWVLASGGSSSTLRAERPESWPQEAPWRAEFFRHEVAVARGSWVLRNL